MTLTWQKMSSPPSNGLMKPKPRGFQRQASPFLRAPASPPPPPPPRPRLRLREPPPPRERLRERLCLEGLSASLVANYWANAVARPESMASAVLAEELPSPYVPAHPASTTAPHSIHHIIQPLFTTIHHIISTIIHDYITSFQPSFTTSNRDNVGWRAQRIDTSPSQWGLMCVLDVQRPGLLTGAGAGPLGRSAP